MKNYQEALKRIKTAETTKRLDLADLGLETLPREVMELQDLEVLDISFNNLKEIPEEIGRLGNLRELVINDSINILFTKFTNPFDIKSIGLLKYFTGSKFNKIKFLPKSIGQLEKLESLILWRGLLAQFPEEILELKNIRILKLSNISLSNIPSQIAQCSKLESLDLSGNKLQTLPEGISQLVNLQQLDLSENKLQTLPEGIIQLVNLQRLDLSNNSLQTLPEGISQLVNLKWLYLSDNSLQTLPEAILNLLRLQHFDLRENPKLNLPPEILEEFTNAQFILHYLKENYFTTHKIQLNEAKVVLVGQGSVGKTSLVKRLMENKFNKDENTTEGIDIHHWFVEIKGNKVRLNVWDFGGQEILHATHQFFLTKRTLYILVYDMRQDFTDNRLEYWLKTIESFGGESPIIMVGNKLDQHNSNLDVRFLQHKYRNIQGFYKISCQDGRGINEVKQAIDKNIAQLPHVFDKLNSQWMAVKNFLENLSQNYITYERYQEICQENKVENIESQSILVSFLHDLGIILNFKEDPRLQDKHVLNPEWVTKAIYKIIRYDKLLEDKGVFKIAVLQDLLDNNHYPPHMRTFLIGLMQKFELCFEMDNKTLLIPEALPKQTPDTGEWHHSIHFQYHYNILPNSIISRFIVRMHNYIYQKTYWHTGVLLEKNQAIAEIKADIEDKKIFIRVKGEYIQEKKELLSIIREDFNKIHKTISGLEVSEQVPIMGYKEVTVDYNHLIRLEKNNVKEYWVEGTEKPIEVKSLLEGINSKINADIQTNTITQEYLEDIHNILSELINDADTIKAIAEIIGLNINIINFKNNTFVIWLHVISQAKKQEKLRKLLDKISKIYSNNSELKNLITQFFYNL